MQRVVVSEASAAARRHSKTWTSTAVPVGLSRSLAPCSWNAGSAGLAVIGAAVPIINRMFYYERLSSRCRGVCVRCTAWFPCTSCCISHRVACSRSLPRLYAFAVSPPPSCFTMGIPDMQMTPAPYFSFSIREF